MNVLLIVLALVAVTVGAPQSHPIFNYHRHKRVETAMNTDGSRLMGGTPAFYGDFPSKAGLIITGIFNQEFEDMIICGATLLTNTKLITAAHCWRVDRWQGYVMTVVLGTPFLFVGGRRILTNRVELHQGYDEVTLKNNIAMIIIDPVQFNAYIRPARLPPADSGSFLGSVAQAVGYGVEGRFGLITPYQLLTSARVEVIPNDVCEEALGFEFAVTNATICTYGGGPTGLCDGDYGSPLLIGEVVIGIGSYHSWMCDDGHPSGYTRITSYLDWIQARL